MHRRRRPVAGRGVRAGAGLRGSAGGGRAAGAVDVRARPHRRRRPPPLRRAARAPPARAGRERRADAAGCRGAAPRSTTRCATGSSPRRAATPSRCWSCPAARRRRGWRAASSCPTALSVPRRIEEMFRQRSRDLPAETQLLLLLAAADPTGDAAVLWRAAERAGDRAGDGSRPRRPPGWWRSTVGCGSGIRWCARRSTGPAAPPDRRRVHGALAAVTDPRSDPDRRAWHRAQAVHGHRRGGRRRAGALRRTAPAPAAALAAAAAFLQRAAELTPDPARRAEAGAGRAAHAKHEAGASEAAAELLTLAAAGPLDALQRRPRRAAARTDRLPPDARQRRAARCCWRRPRRSPRWTPRWPARPTCKHSTRRSSSVTGGREACAAVADAARAAPAPPGPPRPGRPAARRAGDDVHAGATRRACPALRRAARGVRGTTERRRRPRDGRQRPLAVAGQPDRGRRSSTTSSPTCCRAATCSCAREAGALATLPAALSFLVVLAGPLRRADRAGELAAEQTAISAGHRRGPPAPRPGSCSLRGAVIRPTTAELHDTRQGRRQRPGRRTRSPWPSTR